MLKKLWQWLTGVADKIKNSLSFGKDIANDVKTITDSTLLDIIVKLTPSELDDAALAAFRLFMSNLLTKLNWADKLLDNADQDEKTIILHTLSAASAYWQSQQNESGLSLQTTLSTSQLVYDKSKVNMSV
ncbi:hypothetical protein ACFQZX_03955 [Mucilaginibacter litoreus]|uniref:Uncharacterized protein n=1 Tax=Mucilaginibacter litoreus TaxID=1048221 RepID=A0ABW3AR62_9SPHI